MRGYIIVCAMLVCFVAQGQDFEKFKFGMGIDFAQGNRRDGGGLYFEPMYRVTDNIAIGLKIEYTVMGSGQTATPASTITSFSFNGQYYFNKNEFRPFVGAGVGSYSLGSELLLLGANSVGAIGYYPRLGFDYRHFNLTLDYNFISGLFPSDVTVLGIPVATNSDRDPNYFGIKMGFSIGGGPL